MGPVVIGQGVSRGNDFKLEEGWFRLDTRKTFSALIVVRQRKRLHRDVLDDSSLEAFKV